MRIMALFDAVGAFFMEMIETVAVVLSIFLVIYLFLVQPHQVNGLSMFPTFNNGDYVLTDKVSYRTRAPKRGEVIVFNAPPAAQCPEGTGCDFIKRIIGLPGDRVEVHDNAYWINGVKLDEPYIPPENYTLPGVFTENRVITLGPSEYFVSGDNRPHSSDSRAWGPITSSEIIGRVILRYWPLNKLWFVPEITYKNP
jgi:signal peptidase I